MNTNKHEIRGMKNPLRISSADSDEIESRTEIRSRIPAGIREKYDMMESAE